MPCGGHEVRALITGITGFALCVFPAFNNGTFPGNGFNCFNFGFVCWDYKGYVFWLHVISISK